MMCEGASKAGARTGSVSATFTLFGQGNATLRASSHFFITLGQLGPSGARRWRKGSKEGMKGGMKREVVFKPVHSPKNCIYI